MVGSDLVMFGARRRAIAVLLLTGSAELWQLVRRSSSSAGTANAFFFPASSGLVAAAVSARRAARRRTRCSGSRSSTTPIVGAGARRAASSPASAPAGRSPSTRRRSSSSAAFSSRHPRSPRGCAPRGVDFVRELREGWGEFRSRTWLWSIVVQFTFINAFSIGAYLVLGPVVADEDLGGAAAWGLDPGRPVAAGLVLGGLVMLRCGPQRLLLVASLAILLSVPVCCLLGDPGAARSLIAVGRVRRRARDRVFGVIWDTAMQQQIPQDRLSRVYSYDALGSFVLHPDRAVASRARWPTRSASTETLVFAGAGHRGRDRAGAARRTTSARSGAPTTRSRSCTTSTSSRAERHVRR